MRKILGAFLLMGSILTVNGWAGDGNTGCGLGSMIWQQQSLVSDLFRMTTNHSFSSQLFGISTGTSGCTQHGIVKADMAPVYYAEANIENLKVEMAQGDGEYLSAFAQTLGCDDESAVLFKQTSKERYGEIFNEKNIAPDRMLGNVKKVIGNNQVLKQGCHSRLL